MSEREELTQIVISHPEIAAELLALLRALRGQLLEGPRYSQDEEGDGNGSGG